MSTPTSLQTLIAQAAEAMGGLSQPAGADSDGNAFVFTGNFQQPVPEALIYTSSLQATDVRLWMGIRNTINNPKIPGSLPSREELAELIHVSPPTVSKSRAHLRCARWLTRCQEVRDAGGRFVGHIYLFHDTPLSIEDTLQLDNHYIGFLEESAKAKNNAHLRDLAISILNEIDEHIISDNRHPETRLESMERIVANQCLAPLGLLGFGAQSANLSEDSPAVETVEYNQRKNLSPVKNSQHSQSKVLSVEDAPQIDDVSDNIINTEGIDQKVTRSKNLSAVENPENHQRKNLSPVRSTCSSTCINNISNNGEDAAQQNPTRDWETFPPEVQSPESIRSVTDKLLCGGSLSATDLVGFTRILKFYSPDLHADIIDQVLGHILATVYGHRTDKVRNPTAYLKKLAKTAKYGEFVLDYWGQLMAKARLENTPPEITWTDEKLQHFKDAEHVEG